MDEYMLANLYILKIDIANMRKFPLFEWEKLQRNFTLFDHFDMTIIYNSPKKNLADKNEKQLMQKYQRERSRNYNMSIL